MKEVDDIVMSAPNYADYCQLLYVNDIAAIGHVIRRSPRHMMPATSRD